MLLFVDSPGEMSEGWIEMWMAELEKADIPASDVIELCFSIFSCYFTILTFPIGTSLLADKKKATDDSLLVVQIKVGPNGEGMLVSVLYWTRTASL
jgi:hypothetical protein